MYLLDTCVVSDFVKGDKKTLFKIKTTNPDDLYLSSISYMEIEYGLQKKTKKAESIRAVIHDFLSAIHHLNFGNEEAKSAALIREDLAKKGMPIGPYDLLIAGVAMHHRLKLVTSNVSEFQRVDGLIVENWR